jgi:hypothetical protein
MEVTTAERYASGGPTPELFAPNLGRAFRATVDRIPDDPAVIAGEGSERVEITWREMSDWVSRIAGASPRSASARATPWP